MRDAPVCIVYIQQFLSRIQRVYAWCDLIDTTHRCWVMDLILVVGGDECECVIPGFQSGVIVDTPGSS